MNIHPVRTKQEYKAALRRLSVYFDSEPEPGTVDGDCFEILTTLVEAYETKHFPIAAPDPVEAIRFRMEQGGLVVKDLVPSIGRANRVYEILNGKRGLTLDMIRNLHRNLGIPAESLIGASCECSGSNHPPRGAAASSAYSASTAACESASR